MLSSQGVLVAVLCRTLYECSPPGTFLRMYLPYSNATDNLLKVSLLSAYRHSHADYAPTFQ